MRIIVTTPNYKFGQDMKKSAPAGISVIVGYEAAFSPNAEVAAVALVGFNKATPCDVARELFVTWLLDETMKDERCTLSYDGGAIEKQASVLGRIFYDMEMHKNDKPNPEDDA